jgi:hypothetical protein
MNRTTYGLDIAKHVFQMYWVDADTGEIVNRRFSRTELLEFLSKSSSSEHSQWGIRPSCAAPSSNSCEAAAWARLHCIASR